MAVSCVCLYLLATRFISRDRIKRFLAPHFMEMGAYAACVLVYTHLLGFALFQAEACDAQPCEAAATTSMLKSLWCWAFQLNVSLLKVDDEAQRLKSLDVPNFTLLCLWLLRVAAAT